MTLEMQGSFFKKNMSFLTPQNIKSGARCSHLDIAEATCQKGTCGHEWGCLVFECLSVSCVFSWCARKIAHKHDRPEKSNLTLVGCEHVLGLLTSISGWMAVLWDTSDQRRDPKWQGWISLVDTIASCWTRLSCECCQCLRCHGGRVQFAPPRCNVGSFCPARFKF